MALHCAIALLLASGATVLVVKGRQHASGMLFEYVLYSMTEYTDCIMCRP